MMIRPFTLFCALFAGVSGMVLYAQKHKTTQLDKEITKIVYDTQKIKARTAMLRTEWTLLNQPDRLKELANNFIPGLRPLSPSQFVQMASATSVLPPIKQDPDKDKTREDLIKNVAQNNGQEVPFIVNPSENAKKAPPLIAQNADNTTQPKPQAEEKPVIKPTVTVASNKVESETAAPAPVRRKKVKTTEVADAIETQNTKPQAVKKPAVTTATNNAIADSSVPVRRKKIKTTEVADATDTLETQSIKPQAVKKNHIQNVSYNIQSDNPFSHNKAERLKQAASVQTSTTNNEAALEKKLTAKPKQQAASNAPKKRPAAIKVARNESRKTAYSESALGGNSDEALPAPVPFSH